ncbi:cytochrome P450 [Streptomyces sp. NPDC059629]|uniref:cytochrome P450 n=1 Tax=Streptomyces sp. NPDC059629 TaxID=3346889 RepID=UPI0036D07B33
MTSPAPTSFADPFPWPRGPFHPSEVYGWLREEQPVVRVDTRHGRPVWLVTRYDDVRAVLSDPRVSSDAHQPGFPQLGPTPEAREGERLFLRMDAPEHTVFRRLLSRNFMVKRVEAMRPRIQQLVDDTLTTMLASPTRSADLVQALALPVPSTVLSWILGVRAEDREFFNKATEELLGGSTPEDLAAQERAQAAYVTLHGYIEQLVAEKEALADPGDDILGQLVTASRAGSITHADIVSSGFLLIVAGHDTTASMTGTGTLTLLQHPDQLAELRAAPELIPAAVEELLRYLTVVHLIVLRVATEDIEVGGVTIPAGEGIVPLNISANRDDAHYPDADRFDIHRAARDHFAFGFGMHQCLGQPLARVELQVIFETLLRRVPTLRLAVPVDEVPFKLWSPINGVASLPVTW